MVKKEFLYRGKTLDDIKRMSMQEFAKLVPARSRRAITRGFSNSEKNLLEKIGKGKDRVKTHCRDMVVVPVMVGKTIQVYAGKEYVPVLVAEDMLGHRLGEFALTCKKVTHGALGVGATKSSSNLSVK